jgi:hypothetical protein
MCGPCVCVCVCVCVRMSLALNGLFVQGRVCAHSVLPLATPTRGCHIPATHTHTRAHTPPPQRTPPTHPPPRQQVPHARPARRHHQQGEAHLQTDQRDVHVPRRRQAAADGRQRRSAPEQQGGGHRRQRRGQVGEPRSSGGACVVCVRVCVCVCVGGGGLARVARARRGVGRLLAVMPATSHPGTLKRCAPHKHTRTRHRR